jgi:hypothetical protein
MFGNLRHLHCHLSLYGHLLDEVSCSNKTVELFQSCTSEWSGGGSEDGRPPTHTQMYIVMMTRQVTYFLNIVFLSMQFVFIVTSSILMCV